MVIDMQNWQKCVIDEVRGVADEKFQRDVWFGGSTDRVDSPDEQFCRFFDNACVPEFLARPDHGLSQQQASQLTHLSRLMRTLSDATPVSIKPEDLIDDPRWIEIRKQAAKTLQVLSGEG